MYKLNYVSAFFLFIAGSVFCEDGLPFLRNPFQCNHRHTHQLYEHKIEEKKAIASTSEQHSDNWQVVGSYGHVLVLKDKNGQRREIVVADSKK